MAQVILPLSGKRSTHESVTRETRPNIIAVFLLLIPIAAGVAMSISSASVWPALIGLGVGFTLAQAPKIAKQWERAVILRLGRYVGLRGPGLFWIVPFVDTVTRWIDQRVITTSFAAEQTLTSDTVPVNVDAVLFWLVYDPEKAALEVQEYQQAVSWAAQTALRDIIGRTSLGDLLQGSGTDRGRAAAAHRPAIQSLGRDRAVGGDARRRDSRSRCRMRCRARRRRRGRSRRASSSARPKSRSRTCSQKAAESYRDNPTALHLRAMNMLYEGLKEKGALMLVPSTAVESMGMGGLIGAAALRQQALADSGPSSPSKPL